MRGSGTSSKSRLRAATISVLTGALTLGLLATGAGPASAAPEVCADTQVPRTVNAVYAPYTVRVCLTVPDQPDPVDVTAKVTVNDSQAMVQRVRFVWNGDFDHPLLVDNDPSPDGSFSMRLISRRVGTATGNLTARAVLDNNQFDGASNDATADSPGASVTPDTVTPLPQYTTADSGRESSNAAESRARSSAGGRKRPSRRLPTNGRFTAPGTWPATGSIGSTSPRKRSGARASNNLRGVDSGVVSSRTVISSSGRGRAVKSLGGWLAISSVTGHPSPTHAG